MHLLPFIGLASLRSGNKITLTTDPQNLSQLREDQRAILTVIVDSFNKLELQSEPRYELRLPLSQIIPTAGKTESIITLSDLFKSLTETDEPGSLAIDENGDKKNLSAEQLLGVRKDGCLRVPSKKHFGQYHAWQLNNLLQEGSEVTRKSFESIAASSIKNLRLTAPTIFVEKIGAGLRAIEIGTREILDSLVGLVNEHEKYTQGEKVAKMLLWASDYALVALRSDPTLDPTIFRDDLYRPEVTKKLQPEVSRIGIVAQARWAINEPRIRDQLLSELKSMRPEATYKNLTALVDETLENMIFDDLNQFFRLDTNLTLLNFGYGDLVADSLLSSRIHAQEDKSHRKRISEKELEVTEKLKTQHPILSLTDGWLQPQVSSEMKEFIVLSDSTKRKAILDRQDSEGLQLSSYMMRKRKEYEEEEALGDFAKLSNMMIPDREYVFESRILFPDNWIKVVDYDKNGQRSYSRNESTKTIIKSDTTFWRFRIVAARSEMIFKNGLHSLTVNNIWNGRLGLRAMNPFSNFFYSKKLVDSSTGDILDDKASLIPTYTANLGNRWNDYQYALVKFEKAPDNGLLGKIFSRPIFQIYQFLYWAASTLILAAGQPALTFLNVAVSTVIAAGIPLLAVGISVSSYILTIIIFDFDCPDRRYKNEGNFLPLKLFPVPFQLLNILFYASLWWVFPVLVSFFYEVPLGIMQGLYAYAGLSARTLYDALMFALIKNKVTVPGVDTFWARRTHGPGLSSLYRFQVEPEVVYYALQAALEKLELDFIQTTEQARIDRPLVEFNNYFRNISKPFRIFFTEAEVPLLKELRDERELNRKKLNDAVRLRMKKLEEALLLDGSYATLIKLTEESIENTLDLSQQLVRSFYFERLVKHLDGSVVNYAESDLTTAFNWENRNRISDSQELKPSTERVQISSPENPENFVKSDATKNFWGGRNLFMEDFDGLTRYLLAGIFGGEFLTPLQRTDKDFVIKITQPSYKDLFTRFPSALDTTVHENTEMF